MTAQVDERVFQLQEQIRKLQSQKDALIKELDEMEEGFEQTIGLYRKYFPLILDMFSHEESDFANACKELANCLKQGASTGKLSYVFDQLKTAIIKEEVVPNLKTKKKGLFSSFRKTPFDGFLDAFKHDYQEVLNQLRSTMEERYATRLDAIGESIVAASDATDVSDTRHRLFEMIFQYISETNNDREKVTLFIQEIVTKIFEIEKKLASSYAHASSLYEAEKGFEDVLINEMKSLAVSSNISASLEDLKKQISQRLTSIDSALQKKQMADKVIRTATQKNREAFKSGFVRLKKELNDATRYSEELEKKLNKDQLTGAFNRRAYDKMIEDEMARFKRYGTCFSLLLIDADHFKRVNDNYGHAAGDKCLKEIIHRTLPLLRKNDMLARYGGEEFAVIMPGTDINGAVEAAEKIRKNIEKISFIYKQQKVQITVSIGVTQAMEGDQTSKDLFERADVGVYQAKEQGRNKVVAKD